MIKKVSDFSGYTELKIENVKLKILAQYQKAEK